MQPVARGAALSTKNLKHATARYQSKQKNFIWQAPTVEKWQGATFDGYLRTDGSAGTANYWLMIPLVFCENRNLMAIQEALNKTLGFAKTGPYQNLAQRLVARYQDGASNQQLLDAELVDSAAATPANRIFPNVDGIKFLTHEGGCGGTKGDANNLCGLLAGYINHPNVAGATVLSLGCQNAQVAILKDEIRKRNPDFDKPLFIFEQQQSKSEHDMLTSAIKKTFVGLVEANKSQRSAIPISKLLIGVECGGSDGFSGISANPVIGKTTDYLVACGGGVILSEFPELCGVEQNLVDRCVDQETGDRFINLMRDYEAQAKAVGTGFYMNPSAGNIKDGLITDAIKSAGAAKKGGTSPVVDALDYPQWVRKNGLNLLCTPGGDVESTTAMAGAGATLILFSTGLGTPTGNPVVPVIKISSNTDIATKHADIIDFDTGTVINGTKSIEELGAELLNLCIESASGRIIPKAVQLGHDEFIPWKRGVSL